MPRKERKGKEKMKWLYDSIICCKSHHGFLCDYFWGRFCRVCVCTQEDIEMILIIHLWQLRGVKWSKVLRFF